MNKTNFRDIYNSAVQNFQKDNLKESLILFEKLKEIHPWPSVYNYIGLISLQNLDIEKAVKNFKYAITLQPDNDNFINNLALCHLTSGDIEKANELFKKAVGINPNEADYYNNLGTALIEEKEYEKALSLFNKSLEFNSENTNSIRNIALLELLRGNFQRGWELYEIARDILPSKHILKNIVRIPEWDGSYLNGKRIYVCWEQGFGDTIQFIRYLPFVADKGGKIVLNCKPEIKNLFDNLDCIDHISTIPTNQLQNEKTNFDTFIMLMSLPKIFGTTLENVPSEIPYLFSDITKKALWKKKLSLYKNFKIGFTWHNRFPHPSFLKRSCPLEFFYSLAKGFPEITFFDLQVGNTNIISNENPPSNVINLSHEIKDFSDTAAIMDNLDLIISVDTAAVHLAAALGKPVWNLLPFSADWRWLIDRDYTPWYRTMRLVRQEKWGDWESVFIKIRNNLPNQTQ